MELGREVVYIVKNNFYNDNLEIELFVISPKGTTEVLVKLNGNVIDGIKIIITNINK